MRTPKIFKGSPEYFESQKGEEDKNPLYIMMNLETRCGYRCPKCALPGYRHDMKKPLTLAQRQEILWKARDIGIRELVIIGAGEPTEHFEDMMQPLIASAYGKDLGAIIFTTTSHLTRQQAEFYRDSNTSIFVSLDGLDPETYRKLTGNGTLEHVLANIQMLREVYGASGEEMNGYKVVRLGINVTVVKQNKDQLDAIRDFAGDDMKFIANFPIRRGRLKSDRVWQELVGEDYPELQKVACEKSDTLGHSSMIEGVCGYFSRGISVDIDGELLTCAYASETADLLGRITSETTPEGLKECYHSKMRRYKKFAEKRGFKPSCPLRDDDYQEFLEQLKK